MFAHASTPELIDVIVVLDVANVNTLDAEAARQLWTKRRTERGISLHGGLQRFRKTLSSATFF